MCQLNGVVKMEKHLVEERIIVKIINLTKKISLSKRTFQGDAVVKSAKARDSRRRSRAKFNLLSTDAIRLGGLHSQILAYVIPLSLLWHVLKTFVRFFSS